MAYGDAPIAPFIPGQLPPLLTYAPPKRPLIASPSQQSLAQALQAGGSVKTALAAQDAQRSQQMLANILEQGQTRSTTPLAGALNLAALVLSERNNRQAQTTWLQDAAADRADAAQRAQQASDAAAGVNGTGAALATSNPNSSIEDDVRAAYAAANAKLPGQLGQADQPAVAPEDHTPGAPPDMDAKTSASGGPLMIGGDPPSTNVGVPVDPAARRPASGWSNPSIADLVPGPPTAAEAGQPAAASAGGADNNILANLLQNMPGGQAASSQASPDQQAMGAALANYGGQGGSQSSAGATGAGQPTAPWGIDPGVLSTAGAAPSATPATMTGQAPPLTPAVMSGQQPSPMFASLPAVQPGLGPPASPPAAAGAGSPSVSPTGSPAARAFSFFVGKGYSPTAAAGLVGNLQAESGLNAAAYNPSERAGGIAQWRGARLDALKAYAAANGSTPDNLDTQLGFMAHELKTSEGHANAGLQNVSDPVQAAAAASAYFRPAGYRPGGDPTAIAGWSTRAGAAQAAMGAFGQASQAQRQAVMAARGLPPGSVQTAQAGASPLPFGSPQSASDASQGGAGGVQYGQPETSRERAVVAALISSPDPNQRAQALSILQSVQERELAQLPMDARYSDSTGATTYTPKTPGYGHVVTVGPDAGWRAPLPSGMAYNAQGVAQPIPGTGYTDAGSPAPGTFAQRGPDNKLTVSEIPNASASAPAGTAWTGSGYAPVQGAGYGQPQRIPGTDLVGQRGPDGSIKSVGSVSLGPKDLQAIQSGYAATEEAKNYSEALAARRAMGVAASQANGAGDYAMLDTYARAINPGAVARLGTIEAIKQSRDVPAQIRGEVQHWGPNGGTLSPASRQQLLNSTDAFVGARWQALQPRLQDAQDFAQRNNLDPASVVPRFDPPMAAQPQGGGQTNSAAVLQDARAALQRGAPRAAVVQRLQAMGVNPAGL